MSTDRELLELAAVAAGINTKRCLQYEDGAFDWPEKAGRWNPLTDDGDALRLMNRLPFRELYVSEIGATVSWRRDGSQHGMKCDEYASEHGGDLNAATRRAIVRAAVQAEREANAQIAECYDLGTIEGHEIAAAIRARSTP